MADKKSTWTLVDNILSVVTPDKETKAFDLALLPDAMIVVAKAYGIKQ